MYANMFLFMILLFSQTVLGQYQCYYGHNLTMDVEFIPCGPHNSTGASTCCYLGDICLAHGACNSPSTGMTYVAGCTDPLFLDPSCAGNVCDKTAQVEGLALCDNNNWICCSGEGQQGDKPAKAGPDTCPCSQNFGTIATGSAALMQTAYLPSSFGGEIQVIQTAGNSSISLSSEPIPTSGDASLPPTAAPFTTTTTTAPTTTSSNPSSPLVASQTGAPESTPSPASSSGSNLTLPLALGLALGLPLLLVIVALVVRYYRRRTSRAAAATAPAQHYYNASLPGTTVYSPSLATSQMGRPSLSSKQGYQTWQSPPQPHQREPSELSASNQVWHSPPLHYRETSELGTPDTTHGRREMW